MKFLKISSKFLKAQLVFTFDLFLYDTERDTRLVALYKNSPVTEELINSWIDIEKKGGYLQIIEEELDSFCNETKTSAPSVERLNAFNIKMDKIQKERINTYSKKVESSFLLKTFLLNEDTTGFMPLIERVKSEVMLFELSLSKEVSFTTDLVDKLFTSPILPVKIAAFSYMFAKLNKIDDPEVLCSIINGALFKDIGMNQISRSLFFNKDYYQGALYKKHPMLSIFLLSKSGFEFSKLTKRIILEQHEVIDGSGFPRGKKEDFISPMSQIVHLSDQVIKLASGHIDGKKYEVLDAIKKIVFQVPIENLIFNFSTNLLDNLKSLLPVDLES